MPAFSHKYSSEMSHNFGACCRGFASGVALLGLLLALAGCSHESPKADSPPPRRESVKNVNKAEKPKDSLRGGQRNEDAETYVKPFTLPEKGFQIELIPDVVMEFIGIPSGSFMMGNNVEGVRRHREAIAEPYYLGKYEVTQQQWQALMGNNPSMHKGPPNRPVERINWDDCQTFLQKLNEKCGDSGKKFGLPTEAQWEFACRSGITLRFNSTDNPDKIGDYGWYGLNAQLETHPVGQKKPNAWGLYDMHGNVAEWCADNAANTSEGKLAGNTDPSGSGEFHVVRGGLWRDSASAVTSMSRIVRRATVTLRFDGFRVMAAPK